MGGLTHPTVSPLLHLQHRRHRHHQQVLSTHLMIVRPDLWLGTGDQAAPPNVGRKAVEIPWTLSPQIQSPGVSKESDVPTAAVRRIHLSDHTRKELCQTTSNPSSSSPKKPSPNADVDNTPSLHENHLPSPHPHPLTPPLPPRLLHPMSPTCTKSPKKE
jgi:hypothetical protein